jgi:hypothetical protein
MPLLAFPPRLEAVIGQKPYVLPLDSTKNGGSMTVPQSTGSDIILAAHAMIFGSQTFTFPEVSQSTTISTPVGGQQITLQPTASSGGGGLDPLRILHSLKDAASTISKNPH